MANNYSQFDVLMKKLIDGTIDKNNFNGTSLEKFAEHQDVFWDGLLQYLQYESDTAKIKHFGIRESDFNKSEIKKGIAEFINENCDLADDFLDSCLAQTDGHWNESYNAVLKYFNEMYGDTEIDETNIKVSDIINANAGNSFESNVNIKWVMPWENMDKENYAEVRGNDKIVSVLDNSKYLQFTHLFDKYLRLLMPEYQRDVHIEDLDRNFWVIGQVLTGICSYLFNGESPLNELFDGMLDEITQLWENVLYLWTAFAIVSQYDKFMSIQPIVVPINAEREYIYYQRYDNYDKELNPTKENLEYLLTSIWNNNKFLADNYKNSTVVIIPEIRENSYLENYYAKAIYPGAIIINRRYRMGLGQDENNATNQSVNIPFEDIQFYPFLVNNEMFSIEIKENCSAAICGQDVSSILWGYTEKNFKYQFFKPFNGNIGSGADKIIAEIRTIFTDVNLIFSDYQHYTFDFEAKFVDVAKELAGEEEFLLGNIEFTDQSSEIEIVRYGMELNTEIWGNQSERTLDTDTFSATNSPYKAYTGKYTNLKDYVNNNIFQYGELIDDTVVYCGQAADVSPLGGAAAFYYNENYEGTPEPYIQRSETVSIGLSRFDSFQTQHTSQGAVNCHSAISSILYYKGAVQGADNTRWVENGGQYIDGEDYYNVANNTAPIVDFDPKCLFGVIYVVAGNDNDGVTTMSLHQLETGNYSNYKIYTAFMRAATVYSVSGVPPYTTNFREIYSSALTPNKKGYGFIDYTPWEVEGKQYINYIQNGETIENYPSIPIFGFDLAAHNLYHYNKLGFSWRSYHYVSNGAERDWATSYSFAPIFYGATYATFENVYCQKSTDYSDISMIAYMDNTAENRENIRKMAACYGIYFTDYNYSDDSTLFEYDNRYTNEHMCLGLLRDGVGYGDYTHGAGNVDNPAFNWTSSHESGYTPPDYVGPQPPVGRIKITKGHYRGENVSWQKIVEPTMSITIEKNWINVPYGENFNALIELVGKDKYNVEQVLKRKLFTSNGASSYTFDNLPSYDIYGEIMHYTATEIQPPEGNWNVVGMNTEINYNSVNKTATFTNTYQT